MEDLLIELIEFFPQEKIRILQERYAKDFINSVICTTKPQPFYPAKHSYLDFYQSVDPIFGHVYSINQAEGLIRIAPRLFLTNQTLHCDMEVWQTREHPEYPTF
jgi:hypothetical protein